jgi:transcriptional regulator GlxA family with amidase domain
VGEKVVRNGLPLVAQGYDGSFHVDCVPQHDGGNDKIQPARAMALILVVRSRSSPRRLKKTVRARALRASPLFNPMDTLLIPGGSGMRKSAASQNLANWISRHERRIRHIASVCTGVYGVAPTGLLNGRKVTTHWRFAADLAESYPELRVEDNALYVRDGKFYTSAGVTAGIDLSLALIEEDFGAQGALSVARELVIM